MSDGIDSDEGADSDESSEEDANGGSSGVLARIKTVISEAAGVVVDAVADAI
ncbi:hypothetical protein [Halorubrum laminariae]|uniref:Uncharacterized protein n=1 Tax=Halorubrum laminariae TaxID=1433523 RepID=A0ABD6C4L7_9EURY|nr:hypothetical protein [Halorubrum laminariae]